MRVRRWRSPRSQNPGHGGYPVSSFLFWQVPAEGRDDVEAYELLRTVKESQNRAQFCFGRAAASSLLVALQGHYNGRKAHSRMPCREHSG